MAKNPAKKTDLTKAGTVAFSISHPHLDWKTNAHGYNFGTFDFSPISVTATKRPNGMLEIVVGGPFKQAFTFQRAMPPSDMNMTHVAITWQRKTVKLYLDGLLADTLNAK